MQTHPHKVLLVDDEPLMLDALSLGLDEDDGRMEIFTAGNGEEALSIVEKNDISVVVADLVMPGLSGMELLGLLRKKAPEVDVIIMSGHGNDAIRREADESGCSFFIDKPFLVSDLRKIILEILDRKKQGFAGVLKNIPLPDLIQMCCMVGTSMAIRVRKGSEIGIIHIQGGDVVHAEMGGLEGEAAFYGILGWASGSFETLGALPVERRTVDKNYQFLLMEAARMVDEAQMGAEEAEEEEKARPVRVLIVDDSAVMRRVLSDILSADERIEVAGKAKNGEEALRLLEEFSPDVITLDVNMPVMDGGTALKHIMIKSPVPVVIISNVGEHSHENIIGFLRLGAVDFVPKPSRDKALANEGAVIAERIVSAARARTERFRRVRSQRPQEVEKAPAIPCGRLAVVLSGPGGHGEILRLVPQLTDGLNTCVLVLQDMPDSLIRPLALHLDDRCPIPVRPLMDGAPLAAPCCYIGSSRHGISLGMISGVGPKIVVGPKQDEGGALLRDLVAKGLEYLDGAPVLALLSGAEVRDPETLAAAKEQGALLLVQDPETGMVPDPLERALAAGVSDSGKTIEQIVAAILNPDGSL